LTFPYRKGLLFLHVQIAPALLPRAVTMI